MSHLQSDTPSMYTSHGVSYYVCHDRIVPITSNVRFLMLSKFECQISIFAVTTSQINLGYIQYTPKLACPFLERGVAAGGLVRSPGPFPPKCPCS